MSGYAIASTVCWIAAATLAALGIGTILRLAAISRASEEVRRLRWASLKTWWVLAVLVITAALLGRAALVVLFGGVSVIAFWELAQLLPKAQISRPLLAVAYGLIGVNYLWIGLGWVESFIAFLPLVALGLGSLLLTLQGMTKGFSETIAQLTWGLLLTAYCPAHAALLYTLPPGSSPAAGVTGYFLLLMILVAINDIAQALIGRRLGKRKIAPRISPNKTWEGFLGGLLTTLVLAIIFGHWLTPFGPILDFLLGLVIALAGVFGDLSVSAIKRDAGAKDSGHLLPGQGGMLDRIDSLIFSAPAFYYLVRGLLISTQEITV